MYKIVQYSIRNGAFHIGLKMPKGGVWQSQTVALATFGQRYTFQSLFTYHVSFAKKGGDKRKAAHKVQLQGETILIHIGFYSEV